jgi:DNA-directed RNA polymerase sigma subunit (sigma70/sigma32)
MKTTKEARNKLIADLRKEGRTLQEIGDMFNITRERVRQIIARRELSTRRVLD